MLDEPRWHHAVVLVPGDRAVPARDAEKIGVGANYLDVCRFAEIDDSRRAIAGIGSVMDGTSARFDMEYDCHSPSEKRWFSMTVTPMKTERGGAVVMHTNITERKRAETALHESEQNLLDAQSMAHIGNWSWDIKANKISWSDELYRIYGIALATPLSYETSMEAVHPEDRDYYNETTERLLEKAAKRLNKSDEGLVLIVVLQSRGELVMVGGAVTRPTDHSEPRVVISLQQSRRKAFRRS